MKKHYCCLHLCLLLFLQVAGIQALKAQPLPHYTSGQKATLKTLQKQIKDNQQKNYELARTQAVNQGRPLLGNLGNGRAFALDGIDEAGNLLYVASTSTTKAGITTRTNSLYAGGSIGVNLSGSSTTVQNRMGMWEVRGKPRASHVEFGSRLLQRDNPTSTDATGNQHSTHVSGILMAAGKNPLVRGMAYGANLQAYDQTNDVSEMTTVAADLLVSNHSYGTISGWNYNSSRSGSIFWEWYGDTTISATEDYKFGFYNSQAQSWDRISYNAPYYLIVKAAGNERGDSGPGANQPYYLVNHGNRISTRPRYDQNAYDLISTYGTAKNILTVGAISNTLNGYNQPGDVKLGSFSSWGPTDDGRIKPDITGVGVSVLSTYNTTDSSYAVLDGTSMATPNVTGSLLLLQEYYNQLNAGKFMRSSTLKGLVLHTADEAGDTPGPDYRFGWGLLDVEQAAKVIKNDLQNHLLEERTLAQGETYTRQVTASGRGPLMVTICWTDPEGTPSAVNSGVINNRAPKLINDLDIRVSDGQQTVLPWILDPESPSQPAQRGDNIRDNIEQVLIPAAVPGRSYTITITHKGNLGGTRQDYALIASGVGTLTYCASAPASSADSKVLGFQLGQTQQKGSDNCTTYTDLTRTIIDVQPGQTLPFSVSVGTCGTPQNTILRVFADWNQNGSFSDAGDTLATSGVLTGVTAFSRNVLIPSTVSSGQLIRVRLVLSETNSPASVSACGTYAKGETMEWLVRTIRSATDVGVTALVSPDNAFCRVTDEIPVAVRIRNYGTDTQQNVPVRVRIADAANTTLTVLTGTLPVINGFNDALFTINVAASRFTAGQSYRFEATTELASDQNPANNTFVESRTVAAASIPSALAALQCGTDTVVALTNNGQGTAFWYDAAANGNLLAVGNRTTTNIKPVSNTYFVSLNDFSGTLGPVSKYVFGGGSYAGNFGPSPLLSTRIPVVLESARLYIASAGRLTFTVRRLDDVAVSSVSLDVAPTRNTSLTAVNANGQLLDDPNDQGAQYPLNLRIPAAGDYKITIEYEGGASIYRSNVGVSGFPYRLTAPNGMTVVSTKGALFPQNGRVDTLTTAWYYLYNLKVRSLDCPSAQRVAVTKSGGTAPTALVTVNGPTTICRGSSVLLQANTGSNLSYQWFRNNQAISGAVSSSYRATDEGGYLVQVSNNCQPASSQTVQLSVNDPVAPLITLNGFVLSSNSVTGNQWLLNGVPITGATGQSYTAVQSGRYSVRVNANGCGELISTELSVIILGLEETAAGIQLYPNPTANYLTVTLDAAIAKTRPTTLILTNTEGIRVKTGSMKRDGKNYSGTLDLTSLSGGIFFVTVQDNQGQILGVKRVLKQ
ncbi:S8 family serine peptidase [Arsenicibacter rosenii]|uniref:Peptidase S8 n=1 Tax=Arsenicibacter rosenii TaxID=1750698 RepID=A0A1S2VGZ7_9BACT|nr:S8 family serine peptidase [Arsenicibacter rosenii]OIN57690.1 peptidase S8 [Arsenicibacter rosenii]